MAIIVVTTPFGEKTIETVVSAEQALNHIAQALVGGAGFLQVENQVFNTEAVLHVSVEAHDDEGLPETTLYKKEDEACSYMD